MNSSKHFYIKLLQQKYALKRGEDKTKTKATFYFKIFKFLFYFI